MKLNFNVNDFNNTTTTTPSSSVIEQQGPFNLTSSSNTSADLTSQVVTVKQIQIPGDASDSVIEQYNFTIASTGDLIEYTFLTSPTLTSTHPKRGYVTKASGPLFGELGSAEVMHKTLPTMGDIEVIFT